MRPRAGAPTSEIPDGNRDCPARGFRKGKAFSSIQRKRRRLFWPASLSFAKYFCLQTLFLKNFCYNIGGPDKGRVLPWQGWHGFRQRRWWFSPLAEEHEFSFFRHTQSRRHGGTQIPCRFALPFLCRNHRKNRCFFACFSAGRAIPCLGLLE